MGAPGSVGVDMKTDGARKSLASNSIDIIDSASSLNKLVITNNCVVITDLVVITNMPEHPHHSLGQQPAKRLSATHERMLT